LAVYETPPVPVRRFTVEEYHRLSDLGLLTEADDVELLEGWIVPKMVHNPPHDNAIELIDEQLRRLLPAGWSLRVQSSITLGDSEPEPDLAVVRGSARERAARHPSATEVALVIEVADSSLQIDRDVKSRLYARALIPFYWIVNVAERKLEIHDEPATSEGVSSYRRRVVMRAGDRVDLVVDQAILGQIEVAHLLP
jgi:Uma2 family endonuclease